MSAIIFMALVAISQIMLHERSFGCSPDLFFNRAAHHTCTQHTRASQKFLSSSFSPFTLSIASTHQMMETVKECCDVFVCALIRSKISSSFQHCFFFVSSFFRFLSSRRRPHRVREEKKSLLCVSIKTLKKHQFYQVFYGVFSLHLRRAETQSHLFD